MNQKERRAARGLQIVAVCCCFCLLAVGAGVTYRAMDREKAGGGETLQKEQPVTAVQSKTIEIAQAEQQREAEKTKEIKEAKEAKETKAQPARKNEQPVFAAPLEGEMKVVLGYSTDHAIYDPTLEQYRTNASVSLSAKQGTEVKAAADGVVKEVKKDAQAGNLVRIAHGEDWLTTYGQLADAVAVKEGESVKGAADRNGCRADEIWCGTGRASDFCHGAERRTAEPDGENENRRMKTEQAEFGVRLVFL